MQEPLFSVWPKNTVVHALEIMVIVTMPKPMVANPLTGLQMWHQTFQLKCYSDSYMFYNHESVFQSRYIIDSKFGTLPITSKVTDPG